jgi:hypothetical protein
MKTRLYRLAIVVTFTCGLWSAAAQGTAFTYQGRVTANGTPFTGAGQFKFALVTSTNFNHQATAAANPPSGGFITIINVTSGGSGYTGAPAVTISGGGGSGAAAHSTVSGGAVTSIVVDNPGSSYSSTPAVTVAPPPPNISYATFWSNDGTSVAGSEPSAAVSVTVSNGVFTVVLGDTTQPNMTAISAALFAQPDLQLRIWFNDGVNGFAALSPVQNLTPAPYAVNAVSASTLAGLTVQQNTNGAPNMIGGSPNNYVSVGVVGATISGGGATNSSRFSSTSATNSVTADFGTVSGGAENIASGQFATVGGGDSNTASGNNATIPGGGANVASGYASFAAGINGRATNNFAFVWSDGANNSGAILPFYSTNDSSFNVRAIGGFFFATAVQTNDFSGTPIAGVKLTAGATAWSTISDRNAKKNLQPVNGEAVLKKLAAIPVEQWNYKWESDTNTPHLGPMAQDFKAAFYPGRDDKSISTLEFDGVELAAIQGLNRKLEEQLKKNEIALREKEARIEALEKKVSLVEDLEERLTALERQVISNGPASEKDITQNRE